MNERMIVDPIRLMPTPRFDDERITVRLDAGAVSQLYRRGRRSEARFRYLVVENRSSDWLAVVARYPSTQPPFAGRRIAPGAADHVEVSYWFERDDFHGPGARMRQDGDWEGMAEIYLGSHADTAPPRHPLTREALSGLNPAMAAYRFLFDVRCVEGKLVSKII